MLHKPLLTPFVALALGGLAGLAVAAPLSLTQAPPGAAREPAPNIIVSVDDSGSMGAAGIATLREALTSTFGIGSAVIDDRIRLGWQSMNLCPGIPHAGASCNNLNGVRPLSGAHRTTFDTWARNLVQGGGTPSHLMMQNAGEYLRRTDLGINSPWAANPGVAEAPVLSCRKNYHIFMTDGGWNSGTTNTLQHVDTAATNNGARISQGGGNADGTAKTMGDGTTAYSITAAQTRLYRDNWGGDTVTALGVATNLSTLSDLAFHYWSSDLQPTLANNVRSTMNVTATEVFSATNGSGASQALDPFWNPRNNPATWQNMVNYTIGFNTAATWTGSPTWGGSTFAGDLPNLVTGQANWPTPFCGAANAGTGNMPCDGGVGYGANPLDGRRVELWHAALNSRGRFVPAPNAAALVNAFQTILGDILNQTASPLVSIASSSTRLRADGFVYIAGFNSERWSGQLGAYPITAGTNVVAPTPTWTATTQIDAGGFGETDRLVLTSVNGTSGTPFTWTNLSAAQQGLLQGADTATVGQNRVNFLRGDRSLEGGAMRQRDSRLGDIVNSNIWQLARPLRMPFEHAGHASFRTSLSARPSVLFVGANDGMLHAIRASDGEELMAYVPMGVYSKLRDYTLPSYSHQYFVDGHPFTGDADVSGSGTGNGATPDWRTVLVSGLGAGARGYFLLDVTVPPGTSPTASLTSTYTATGVMLDRSFPANSTISFTGYEDVGHIMSLPVVDAITGNRSEQIVKLNNGRWAVLMGNGVNSVNERPVLLIQYLDGSKELLRIIANSTTGGGNGLSAPRVIDVNGDGKVDIAYAGDQLGNLWKFDLSSKTASSWGVSSWNTSTPCNNDTTCLPLYVAQDSGSTRQPISAAPVWMAHPIRGIQVLFGTGRNISTTDSANTATHTIYSIWDKSSYTVPASATATSAISVADTGYNITTGRSALVQQSVSSTVTSTLSGSAANTDFFNTTANNVAYNLSSTTAPRGWYFDLPDSRERVLNNPQIFEGQKVLIGSTVPRLGSSGETCDFGTLSEGNYINVFNMISGAPPQSPVFSSSDSTMNLTNATRTRFGSGEYVSINKTSGLDLITFKNDDPSCPAGQLCTDKKTLTTGNVPGARADWREIR